MATSGVGGVFESATAHQSPADGDFMKKWLSAIGLEEEGIFARRAQLWTMPGKHCKSSIESVLDVDTSHPDWPGVYIECWNVGSWKSVLDGSNNCREQILTMEQQS